MPRQRKPRVPPELLEKLRDLERRAREDSQKTAEVFAKAERLQRRLREIYMSG
ncbi:MAG: hypothetical protein WAT66_10600 [Actinomycetota bacterium]